MQGNFSLPAHMNTTDLLAIANHWFKAFNEKNLENLLALYHDDAQHYSPKLKVRKPETDGLIKGKDSLRSWWEDAFQRLPTLHYEVIRLTPYENRVFMEYIRQVEGEEDMYVGEMLEVSDSRIHVSTVFHR